MYVRYQVTDLGRAEAFLRDFGMQPAGRDGDRLFLRGHGSAPCVYEAVRGAEARFLGAGFRRSSGTKKYMRPMPIGVTKRPTRSWMKSPVIAAPAVPGIQNWGR